MAAKDGSHVAEHAKEAVIGRNQYGAISNCSVTLQECHQLVERYGKIFLREPSNLILERLRIDTPRITG